MASYFEWGLQMRTQILSDHSELAPDAFEAALVNMSSRHVHTHGEPVWFPIATITRNDLRRLNCEVHRLRQEHEQHLDAKHQRLHDAFLALINSDGSKMDYEDSLSGYSGDQES